MAASGASLNRALVESHIREAVRDVQGARQSAHGAGPFLVIELQGDLASFKPQHEREVGGFVVCFDAADKTAIRAAARGPITSIVTAVLATIDGIVDLRKAADAVVFFRADGTPVYSYTFEGATGSLYVSSRVSADQAQTMTRMCAALAASTETARVQRLLRLSSETVAEGLRPFLAAWAALEILINKIFPQYEDSLFGRMSRSESPGVQDAYFSRVREVMKDKYRLLDKFAVIGMQLAPSAVDGDIEVVRRLKKTRDELLHGEEVDETRLPTAEVRRLALRYLRLHLESA